MDCGWVAAEDVLGLKGGEGGWVTAGGCGHVFVVVVWVG